MEHDSSGKGLAFKPFQNTEHYRGPYMESYQIDYQQSVEGNEVASK